MIKPSSIYIEDEGGRVKLVAIVGKHAHVYEFSGGVKVSTQKPQPDFIKIPKKYGKSKELMDAYTSGYWDIRYLLRKKQLGKKWLGGKLKLPI